MMFLHLMSCQGSNEFLLSIYQRYIAKKYTKIAFTLDTISSVDTDRYVISVWILMIFCNMIAYIPYIISMNMNFLLNKKNMKFHHKSKMAAILKSSTFFSHPVEYLFFFRQDKMMCEMVIIFIPLFFKFKVILKVKQRIFKVKK